MKKLHTYSLLFMLFGVVAFLPSCNDDDKGPSKEPRAEYTLMLYGCGGGNLDEYMQLNLDEALLQGANDKVKLTGQIKYSAQYQDDPDLKGTRRFVLQDENSDGKPDEAAWKSLYADGTYEALAFDKATGWSKWLKANKQVPTGNPCSSDDHEDYDNDNE